MPFLKIVRHNLLIGMRLDKVRLGSRQGRNRTRHVFPSCCKTVSLNLKSKRSNVDFKFGIAQPIRDWSSAAVDVHVRVGKNKNIQLVILSTNVLF